MFTEIISESEGLESFEAESDEAAREKLWEACHEVAFAVQGLDPDKGLMTTEVCNSISDLPGALREARRVIEDYGLDGAILGHVGDGNYHAISPVDANDEEDLARAEMVNAEIVDYALTYGGTSTGEHGIGSGTTQHLKKEHGDSLPFMKKIKQITDLTAS